MAKAIELISRVLAAAVIIVAPGLLGQYLDKRLGTSYLVLLGFGLGLAVGMTYLLLLARQLDAEQKRAERESLSRIAPPKSLPPPPIDEAGSDQKAATDQAPSQMGDEDSPP
jgi:hypothetical protein